MIIRRARSFSIRTWWEEILTHRHSFCYNRTISLEQKSERLQVTSMHAFKINDRYWKWQDIIRNSLKTCRDSCIQATTCECQSWMISINASHNWDAEPWKTQSTQLRPLAKAQYHNTNNMTAPSTSHWCSRLTSVMTWLDWSSTSLCSIDVSLRPQRRRKSLKSPPQRSPSTERSMETATWRAVKYGEFCWLLLIDKRPTLSAKDLNT